MHEYFDWNMLIGNDSRQRIRAEIKDGIDAGRFWENSPKYQTNWNVVTLLYFVTVSTTSNSFVS